MRGRDLLLNDALVEDGRTVILGLSGGPDSVCLLYELDAMDAARRAAGGLGCELVCAHVNHGLRGADADGDELFARDLCRRLGKPFETLRIDAAALAKETGATVEEAGRAARYAFFDEICGKYARPDAPPPCIAVAHNRDDQAETILMRIARGTGIDGLAGMPYSRLSAAGFCVVRPFLGVSRAEIDSRLSEAGVSARLDGSNLKPEYFRNRLRLEVMPYLEEAFGAGFRRSLLRLAENAADDKAYFDGEIVRILDAFLINGYDDEAADVGVSEPRALKLPAELLVKAHTAVRRRLIKSVFERLGLRRDVAAVHLAAADKLLEAWQNGGEASGKYVEFPFDYTFGIEGKQAVFRTPAARKPGRKPRRKQ